MLDIEGSFIKKLPFDLIKKGDLLFFNGPVLSHFISNTEEDYFMFWIDNDKKHTRWLLFRISSLELIVYFSKTKSLKEILLDKKDEPVYIVDLDSSLNFNNNYITKADALIEDYLPGDKSCFNENYTTSYSKK